MKKYILLTVVCALFIASAVLSQNVGIGTTTPVYKLDVLGRMRVKTEILGNVNTSAGIWYAAKSRR